MAGKNFKKVIRKRAGAAAVEFAIAMSVLLLVVFASIELVRLSMLKHSIEHASYLSARKGIIVGANVASVIEAANDHLSVMGVSNATVTVNPSKIDDSTQIVEVAIAVPVSGNSWVSPVYFKGSITGRSRMLAERAAAQMSNVAP